MSKYTELALERRRNMGPDGKPLYSCAQTVATVFARDAGYDETAALRAATFFRGGMQMGSVCGAVTGGLIALGMAGVTDPAAANELCRRIRENHEDALECKALLAASAARGEEKRPFCNALICECIDCVEEALRAKGKL